jgi:multiple sugar transport system permease protein
VFVLLAPVLAFFVVFNTILCCGSWVCRSTTSRSRAAPSPKFVGLRNFHQLWLGRNNFWGDLQRTFTFVGVGVTIQTVLGVGWAAVLGVAHYAGAAACADAALCAHGTDAGGDRDLLPLHLRPELRVLNQMIQGWACPWSISWQPGHRLLGVLAVDCWMWTPS